MWIELVGLRFSSKGFSPASYQEMVYCSGSNSSIQKAFVACRKAGRQWGA